MTRSYLVRLQGSDRVVFATGRCPADVVRDRAVELIPHNLTGEHIEIAPLRDGQRVDLGMLAWRRYYVWLNRTVGNVERERS